MFGFKPGQISLAKYRNYQGKIAYRVFIFKSIYFGSNEFHPEPQWIIKGYDLHRKANRTYTLNDIHEVSAFDHLDACIIRILFVQKMSLIHNLSVLINYQYPCYSIKNDQKLKARLNKLAMFGIITIESKERQHHDLVRLKAPTLEQLTEVRSRYAQRWARFEQSED